ncbi:hypothetical protein HY68_08450 [Streptomyces sp. AcH 505]|nr:hypothetical protein HY68_08450 [Streptomyces sp. AcH 505]
MQPQGHTPCRTALVTSSLTASSTEAASSLSTRRTARISLVCRRALDAASGLCGRGSRVRGSQGRSGA